MRNSPVSLIDGDGRAIIVAAKYQGVYDRAMQSNSFASFAAPYEVDGGPDLYIVDGGNLPTENGRKTLGLYTPYTVDTFTTCADAINCTSTTKGTAYILIDESVQMDGDGADGALGVLSHEMEHGAEGAVAPGQFRRDSQNEQETEHDLRPQEQRAIKGSEQVRKEVKKNEKERREQERSDEREAKTKAMKESEDKK